MKEDIKKIWIALDMNQKIDGDGDVYGGFTQFEVVRETEKAYKFSRFVSYKEKTYECWIPKSVLMFCGSGNPDYDTTHVSDLKRSFKKHAESYQVWFFGIH